MPNTLGKSFPLKITGYAILFLLFYFILPVYLAGLFHANRLILLILFYFVNSVIIAILFNKNSSKNYALDSSIQDIQEKMNLLTVEYLKIQENNIALNEKRRRYASLENLLEDINQSLDLDTVADSFSERVFSLLGNNKGVCALYLVDSQTQRLTIFKTRREDPELVIKSKEGDIFDFWVLRHASPLLIEDIKNDFRFDLDKLKSIDARPISSLISAPLVSGNKFLGLVRLDNQISWYFSQDDLRFLTAISDLGALALENSELFQRAQSLAIHDALTLLYTKGYFSERLKEEFIRCARQSLPLSMLMLDIDLFKNYNDKFGHTAGDIVLREISRIIRDSLNNFSAIISRFGGEEFCCVIAGMEKNIAGCIAEGLREKIAKEKIILRRLESHVTVSIGVASFPLDSADEDELTQLADKALYKAKQMGRNRVCSI
ncbi:MAG: sensor domain-containing diguanylate cyclase [Candidatus Omnitrophota bacterium]|nr:sensor domain-containing diguanylate cyclase [Candidatus Omnitrophota bacterium]